MAPFRIPFSNRKGPSIPGLPTGSGADENTRPGLSSHQSGSGTSVRTPREEPSEYKLSSVNDSGIYLPPSPTEKQSFWHRSPTSTTSSSNHRSLLSETEPFSISRESFESYRRSFDISGRSPVAPPVEGLGRASLDARGRGGVAGRRRLDVEERKWQQPEEGEGGFEDVGLHDEVKQGVPRRKGFLARWGESSGGGVTEGAEANANKGAEGGRHFGIGIHLPLPGRKRGASGGQELGVMGGANGNRPGSSKGEAAS